MAPASGVNVPAAALNVPPVPVVRVHAPARRSAVYGLSVVLGGRRFIQIEAEPSAPAFACGVMFTVATEASFGHGAVPVTV